MADPVSALGVLFVALSDSAFALLVGALLAGLWLDREESATSADDRVAGSAAIHRSLRRLCQVCLAALILAHLVRPWFVASSMSGSQGFGENLALAPDIITSTHPGTVWCIASAALLVLVTATVFFSRPTGALPAGLYGASLLTLAATKAASGHAANDGDFTPAELSMLLHVLGTAVWAGAVVVAGLLVLPGLTRVPSAPAIWAFGNRLSRTVTGALAILLAAGIYTSYGELGGSLAPLWSTTWGQTLLLKTTLVLAALGLGALSRFTCLQRAATAERTLRLARLMKIEAVVMLFILGMSAVLANTPPAMSEESGGTGSTARAVLAKPDHSAPNPQ